MQLPLDLLESPAPLAHVWNGLPDEERVAVVPGDAFGACGAGHIRCSYAASLAELEEALCRMERFVAEVDTVRRALNLKQMHLLGQSWGGWLAIEYMLTHPPGWSVWCWPAPRPAFPSLWPKPRA